MPRRAAFGGARCALGVTTRRRPERAATLQQPACQLRRRHTADPTPGRPRRRGGSPKLSGWLTVFRQEIVTIGSGLRPPFLRTIRHDFIQTVRRPIFRASIAGFRTVCSGSVFRTRMRVWVSRLLAVPGNHPTVHDVGRYGRYGRLRPRVVWLTGNRDDPIAFLALPVAEVDVDADRAKKGRRPPPPRALMIWSPWTP